MKKKNIIETIFSQRIYSMCTVQQQRHFT